MMRGWVCADPARLGGHDRAVYFRLHLPAAQVQHDETGHGDGRQSPATLDRLRQRMCSACRPLIPTRLESNTTPVGAESRPTPADQVAHTPVPAIEVWPRPWCRPRRWAHRCRGEPECHCSSGAGHHADAPRKPRRTKTTTTTTTTNPDGSRRPQTTTETEDRLRCPVRPAIMSNAPSAAFCRIIWTSGQGSGLLSALNSAEDADLADDDSDLLVAVESVGHLHAGLLGLVRDADGDSIASSSRSRASSRIASSLWGHDDRHSAI